MNINFITQEPADEYHARSRSGEFMSSHLLADFRESPALYRMKVDGEIEDKDTAAFVIGRATHSLLLEGRNAFEREYVVSDGPINPRTGESYGRNTKAFTEWAATQDREVIPGKEYALLSKLQLSVLKHKEAMSLLKEGVAEGVVRTEYCGVPCQIRMDWFNPEHGLVDLKTCDKQKYFEHDCNCNDYIHQLAFYRAVIRQVTGETVKVRFIAVEKKAPFACGVWYPSEDRLYQAEVANEKALLRYRECCSTGIWPTGYEEARVIY